MPLTMVSLGTSGESVPTAVISSRITFKNKIRLITESVFTAFAFLSGIFSQKDFNNRIVVGLILIMNYIFNNKHENR